LIAWRGGVPTGEHLLGPIPAEDTGEAPEAIAEQQS